MTGRRVILGVSGSIAAYKSAELLRLLVKAGASVHVVMTKAAQQFVAPLTFETLSHHPVLADPFALDQESRISHVRLADEAELLLVAPATANVIGRFAHGLADDLLSTIHLVTRAPLLLAPAMNGHMWENPIMQANLQQLATFRRTVVVGPETGELAEGYSGLGRMAEPETIFQAVEACLSTQDMAGLHVLVSAGGTREPVDAVREVTNRSSGKMGFALARVARARGAEVVLVAAPTVLPTPWDVRRVDVRTAAEMKQAIAREARGADMIFMAAAVADYRPVAVAAANGKLRKSEVGASWSLELERTSDILASLGRKRGKDHRPLLVGFAAEPGIDQAGLQKKRRDKRCDLLVANDIQESGVAFDADDNHVWLVGDGTMQEIARAPKREVAEQILTRACTLLRAHASA